MNKQELMEQLQIIQDKKQQAVNAQKYEMASQIREKEKELLLQIEMLDRERE
jgi:hypothetical protein